MRKDLAAIALGEKRNRMDRRRARLPSPGVAALDNSMTRHIDFEGIDNFRDLGGYDTACGRGMKAGVVYRWPVGRAADADLAKMADLGITTIVDLRRRRERDRGAVRRWPGFAGQVDGERHRGHRRGGLSGASPRPSVSTPTGSGRTAWASTARPRTSPAVDLFRRYFQALAETNGALVVHCAAGKDRTGLICALTHHIAGVHRDDTLADYLMTNNEARMAARIDFLRSYILDLTGKLVDNKGLAAASVHPDYLDHGLSVISQSHGHIDNYLAEVLGVDSALRGKMRRASCAEPEPLRRDERIGPDIALKALAA